MPKYLRKVKKRYVAGHRKHVRRIKHLVRRPLFSVPIATFLVLLLAAVVGYITFGGTPEFKPNDRQIAIVNHDDLEDTVPTRAATVGELLDNLSIKLHQGDVVEPTADTPIIGDNFRINVYRAVPLTIVDNGRKTFTYSAAATPRTIVKQAGIEVFPEDILQMMPADDFINEGSIGERVVIDRATPVNFNLYGTPVTLRTHAKTVGELLKERGVKLAKDDVVQPMLTTPLNTNEQIFVIRKGVQIVTEERAIPAPTETVEDASLSFGTTVVRQQGAPGKKLITYQIELQNGQEIGRKIIQEVVSQEPVKQVVARGKAVQIPSDKQAVMALAGIAPGDYAYVDFIISHESGWCPTKWNGQRSCPSYYTDRPAGSSGAYGLGQALPGSKMSPFGSDWQTNPVTQLKWADSYAKKYGSWKGAYDFWQAKKYW